MPSGSRSRFVRGALLTSLFAAAVVGAQNAPRQVTGKVPAHRINELKLAGLQPGRDSLEKAERLYKGLGDSPKPEGETVWDDVCRKTSLFISYDGKRKIETIRLSRMAGSTDADCFDKERPLQTGRGLRLGDHTAKVTQLYGRPNSLSPSTKNGQPLELWYHAFDWAGADVPQVMEVLCTREADGKAGRVVEITLAAPSL